MAKGWIGFLLLSEMPAYLEDVLGFSLEMAGILCIFPYLALFLSSLLFGKIFLYYQKEKGMKTRTVRQYGEFISIGGSSIGLLILGYIDSRFIAYSFFIVAQVRESKTCITVACCCATGFALSCWLCRENRVMQQHV